MKTIDDISFEGKRALIRVDFNVPLNNKFEITDETRINAAIPTIKKILKDGGSVVLMSHLGRPKDGPEHKFSLEHLLPRLSEKLGLSVKFADDCIGDAAEAKSNALKAGEVLLLNNLRFYKEETKGDKTFAEKLSKHGDIYVNDAFGTAHRAHASTAIIADFFPKDKMFGYVMAGEIASIDKVLHGSEKPFTAILGGAKVSDKIGIIENLLEKADNLIIGGGMMFTFIKAQGGSIGNSLVEEDLIATAKELFVKAKAKGVEIYIPTDAIVADDFNNEANRKEIASNEIASGWMGLDIGEESRKAFHKVLMDSKTILWNGPMGVFEMENFAQGTKSVALSVAQATKDGAFSLIGGGDSVAAINKYNLADQVSYVSTGGGAMLEYMEGKVLPGIAAIEK
ncbi:MAG: phosphoglycerate kinase [Bacteroidetes bacterium 4572_77]|nr:MAG: phosphoglycerate kinase [Bacteroidetes bacterium 4572_77]